MIWCSEGNLKDTVNRWAEEATNTNNIYSQVSLGFPDIDRASKSKQLQMLRTHIVKASPWVSEGGVEVRWPQQKVARWCLQCREWEGMAWLPVRPSEFQGTFRGQPSRCRASPVGTCLLSAGAPLLTPFLVRKDLPHRTAASESYTWRMPKYTPSLVRLQETRPCLSIEERKGWKIPSSNSEKAYADLNWVYRSSFYFFGGLSPCDWQNKTLIFLRGAHFQPSLKGLFRYCTKGNKRSQVTESIKRLQE